MDDKLKKAANRVLDRLNNEYENKEATDDSSYIDVWDEWRAIYQAVADADELARVKQENERLKAEVKSVRDDAGLTEGCMIMVWEDLVGAFGEEAMKGVPPMCYNDMVRKLAAQRNIAQQERDWLAAVCEVGHIHKDFQFWAVNDDGKFKIAKGEYNPKTETAEWRVVCTWTGTIADGHANLPALKKALGREEV